VEMCKKIITFENTKRLQYLAKNYPLKQIVTCVHPLHLLYLFLYMQGNFMCFYLSFCIQATSVIVAQNINYSRQQL
jgi:hypothetical protein